MAYADRPDTETWETREKWLQKAEDSFQHPLASYLLSAQGTYLSRDMDIAFCAGAWAAVIIMAHAIIDAWLRDTEIGDYKASSYKLFGEDKELHWLRKRRNQLVHVSENKTIFDESNLHRMEQNFESLEIEAKRAVRIAFRVMYANPGT